MLTGMFNTDAIKDENQATYPYQHSQQHSEMESFHTTEVASGPEKRAPIIPKGSLIKRSAQSAAT